MSVVMRKESRLPALRNCLPKDDVGKKSLAGANTPSNAGQDTYPIELGGVRVLQAYRNKRTHARRASQGRVLVQAGVICPERRWRRQKCQL
jgi:hypothetical protein